MDSSFANSATEFIFAKAIELPIGQRSQYVLSACKEDLDMASRIERLLECHEQQKNRSFILNQAVHEGHSEIVSASEKIGDQIGRYKLLEQIGEGGMGIVYMAQQVEGVRRRVALKIIKLGLDTRQVIGRFEAERQAMSMFEHPNITKVFDAGCSQTGRPYFVMELVPGEDITTYCIKNNLSLEQRLNLFVDVCNAVQHAHQKGIIHRDLKPSNILVTIFDGKPVPKVIDFGIAKAVGQQSLTEKTVFTRFSAMIGTPQYMSPEQAELNGADVDTRSDIYSLGVVLYELITGSTPISRQALKEINPLALHETLINAKLETPSSRLARTSASANTTVEQKKRIAYSTADSIAKQYGTSQRRLSSELDSVVMKALSVDRDQRYASSNELAQDILRFLKCEPVLAIPQTRAYQLRTYFKRHQKRILTAAMIATLLIATTIGCIVLAVISSTINRKLEAANQQLTVKFKELESAQIQIQTESDRKLFDSSISIALSKFDMRVREDVFHAQFREQIQSRTNEKNTVMDCVPICYSYDNRKILELPHSSILTAYISRIEEHISSMESFMQQLCEGSPLSATGGAFVEAFAVDICEDAGVHFESGIAVDGFQFQVQPMQDEIDDILKQQKPEFYRELVIQYRKAFGESSPHVSEALMMLAASLAANENLSEARAHLREAILIGDEKRAIAARELLLALSQ